MNFNFPSSGPKSLESHYLEIGRHFHIFIKCNFPVHRLPLTFLLGPRGQEEGSREATGPGQEKRKVTGRFPIYPCLGACPILSVSNTVPLPQVQEVKARTGQDQREKGRLEREKSKKEGSPGSKPYGHD